MSNRSLFAAFLYGISPAIVSAQASSQFLSAPMEQSELTGVVGDLTQNALFILLGAIVLVGIVYICSVYKACSDLEQPRVNARGRFLQLLVLVAGLSTFGSSCTPAQWARAAEYTAAQAAENRTCPMNQYDDNQSTSAANNNYSYNGYSNWHGPVFCKHCGKRIYRNR